MAGASSTLQSNETVSLKLPTGEMIDAVVPGGLSDEDVKSYVQMKRPELFGAPQPNPPQPNMQNASFAQDYSMEAPQTMDANFQRDPRGMGVSDADRGATARGLEGEVGKEAVAGAAGAIVPRVAGALGGRAVVRTLSDPTVQQAIKMKLIGGAATTLGAGAAYKFLKSIGLFKGVMPTTPAGVP